MVMSNVMGIFFRLGMSMHHLNLDASVTVWSRFRSVTGVNGCYTGVVAITPVRVFFATPFEPKSDVSGVVRCNRCRRVLFPYRE